MAASTDSSRGAKTDHTIDGSAGEGGGQVLRISLALACALGKSVTFRKIRGKRAKPGLKAQHLAGVMTLAKLHNADCKGASVGSSDLVFVPGPSIRGRHITEVGTAGACTLVAQGVIPALLFAPPATGASLGSSGLSPEDPAVKIAMGELVHPGSWPEASSAEDAATVTASTAAAAAAAAAAASESSVAASATGSSVGATSTTESAVSAEAAACAPDLVTVRVVGGLDVGMSPPGDFLPLVLLPILRSMGARVAALPKRRGFFPKGGAVLDLVALPLKPGETLKPVELKERGSVKEVLVRLVIGGSLPGHIGAVVGGAAAAGLGAPKRILKMMQKLGGEKKKKDKESRGGDHDDKRAGGRGSRGRGGRGRGRGEGRRRGRGGGAGGGYTPDWLAMRFNDASVKRVETIALGPEGEEVRWIGEVSHDADAGCAGISVMCAVRTECGSVLCRSAQVDKRDDPPAVGARVASELLQELGHGGCVDEFGLDQLVIFAAAAKGTSTIRCGRPSLHATTAADIVAKFLPEVKISFTRVEDYKDGYVMTVVGAGLKTSD